MRRMLGRFWCCADGIWARPSPSFSHSTATRHTCIASSGSAIIEYFGFCGCCLRVRCPLACDGCVGTNTLLPVRYGVGSCIGHPFACPVTVQLFFVCLKVGVCSRLRMRRALLRVFPCGVFLEWGHVGSCAMSPLGVTACLGPFRLKPSHRIVRACTLSPRGGFQRVCVLPSFKLVETMRRR